MGVPSVFQTAPPQPASNARWTWPPEFAGGADASQNGFGDLIPAQSIDRSGIGSSAEEGVNGAGSGLAFGRRVDDLFAAVSAVSSGVPAFASGLAVVVGD